MFDNFTDRSTRVLGYARDEARRLRHEYLGTEHLLLGLLREESGIAASVLQLQLRDGLSLLRQAIEKRVAPGQADATGQLPFTPRAKQLLLQAIAEARELGHQYIGTEHLLLGLLRVPETIAVEAIQSAGLDTGKLRREVLEFIGAKDAGTEAGVGDGEGRGAAPAPEAPTPAAPASVGAGAEEPAAPSQTPVNPPLTPALDAFSRDVPQPGDLPDHAGAVVGRDALTLRVARTLLRTRGAAALLVGPRGAGKRTLVSAVRTLPDTPGVPPELAGMRLAELHLPLLVVVRKTAQASALERWAAVLDQCARHGVVLVIHDIDRFVRPPYLHVMLVDSMRRSGLRCLATVTERAEELLARDAPSCLDAFTRVPVQPLSTADARRVLEAWRGELSARHSVDITDAGLDAAIAYAQGALPGAAVTLLEDACCLRYASSSTAATEVERLRQELEAHELAKEGFVAAQDFERAAEAREEVYRIRSQLDGLRGTGHGGFVVDAEAVRSAAEPL